MSNFSKDKKWMEAKKVIGDLNWLETVSYYRAINGKNVFLYSVIEGDTRLIVDVIDDETVLLLNKAGELETENYDNVMNSRKIFRYSDSTEEREFKFGDRTIKVRVEIRE